MNKHCRRIHSTVILSKRVSDDVLEIVETYQSQNTVAEGCVIQG